MSRRRSYVVLWEGLTGAETKGRSLEELDIIFASAHFDKVNPVRRAKEMPHIEGPELEAELAKYFGTEAEQLENARGH